MNGVISVMKKEFGSFFSTPIALIFIGVFLAANLFIFFWIEKFFSKNIAELRALFEWMPILLIFLTAAITMRSWAEERRAGTLEVLLTAPVLSITLVFGKFFACSLLVTVALLLTFPLPLRHFRLIVGVPNDSSGFSSQMRGRVFSENGDTSSPRRRQRGLPPWRGSGDGMKFHLIGRKEWSDYG